MAKKKNKQKNTDNDGQVQVLDGNGELVFEIGENEDSDSNKIIELFQKILGKKKKTAEDSEKTKKQKMISKIAEIIASEIEDNLDVDDISDDDIEKFGQLAALLSSPLGKGIVSAVRESHRSDYGLDSITNQAIDWEARHYSVSDKNADEFKKYVSQNENSKEVKHMLAVIKWDHAIATRGINPYTTNPIADGYALNVVDVINAREKIESKLKVTRFC